MANISITGGTLVGDIPVEKERKEVVETIAAVNESNVSVKRGTLVMKRVGEMVDVIQGGIQAMEEEQPASPDPDRQFYQSFRQDVTPPTQTQTKRPVVEDKPDVDTSTVDAADEVRPSDGKVDLEKELDIILESEGGFQNRKNDSGNYRPDGVLIGTNRGITVRSLAAYRNVDPNTITEEDMSIGRMTVLELGVRRDHARCGQCFPMLNWS